MRDARKLAQTCSKLGPKIRAEVRTRSSLGFQYSYSLSARDLDARPIPIIYVPHRAEYLNTKEGIAGGGVKY